MLLLNILSLTFGSISKRAMSSLDIDRILGLWPFTGWFMVSVLDCTFMSVHGAIREKLKHIDLRVVVSARQKKVTTTPVPLGKDLLTHEQALKILAGALEALRKRCSRLFR